MSTPTSENDDVPSLIDFHDQDQARAWVDETVRNRPCRPSFFAMFSTALSRLAVAPISVLEVGSGPGHLAREILVCCRTSSYVALDFSAAMHRLARAHLGELSVRVEFLQRDFRDPRWTAGIGPFDVVVTMQAAHETRHKQHLVPLLRQTRSILQPNGHLLYCDHVLEPGGGKNPQLYLDRAGQLEALTLAGFSNTRLLHDECGMALYEATGSP